MADEVASVLNGYFVDQHRPIKAISLWQPWASLAALGAKEYETRSWGTSYRGPLLIHAAKRWTYDERWQCCEEPFNRVLKSLGFVTLADIPLGAALGIVDLTAVVKTETIRDSLSEQERAFGNYADGRFAWKFENVRLLAKPIPMRGFQGLWSVAVSKVAVS